MKPQLNTLTLRTLLATALLCIGRCKIPEQFSPKVWLQACTLTCLLVVGCTTYHTKSAKPAKADRNQFEDVKAKAEMGDAQAQCDIGGCYRTGAGVTQDAAEAVKWYRKAAAQGLAEARNALGVC